MVVPVYVKNLSQVFSVSLVFLAHCYNYDVSHPRRPVAMTFVLSNGVLINRSAPFFPPPFFSWLKDADVYPLCSSVHDR